jgi:hypothetical protein
MKRLYVVVRADLPAGLQLAQACHATREFGLQHPGEDVGDNLVVLQTSTEDELKALVEAAGSVCKAVAFHEPDLGDQLTAAAFGLGAKRMLARLPLAASI